MAEQLLMLALSPTMETGVISRWNKQEGDTVASGEVVCEIETDKAIMEYEAAIDGVLLKILVPEEARAAVGEPIGIVGEEGEDISALLDEVAKKAAPATVMTVALEPEAASTETPSPVAAKPVPVFRREPGGKILTSPLARKLAERAGLDIDAVEGTGPGGRIVKRDIEMAVQYRAAGAPSAEDAETIRVTERRRVIAQRMSSSKFSAPHYYLTVSVAMDTLLDARRECNETAQKKLSLNAFLLKHVAEMLKRYPMVNASWNGETIILHNRADIAVAVAQEDGLITPVVRNCDSRGIREIDSDLSELIEKARDNKLTVEDYEGGTFTLSNLGSYDIEQFTAIINPPQSAILSVGAIANTPVVDDVGGLAVKSCMKMTISCDHRVIDGSVGAEFLRDLKVSMESPFDQSML